MSSKPPSRSIASMPSAGNPFKAFDEAPSAGDPEREERERQRRNRTPNWAKWLHIPNPILWELVALSLGIDPDKIGERDFNEPGDFKDRIRVAYANVDQPGGLCWAPSSSTDAEVNLVEFVKWALGVPKWPLPAELGLLELSPTPSPDSASRRGDDASFDDTVPASTTTTQMSAEYDAPQKRTRGRPRKWTPELEAEAKRRFEAKELGKRSFDEDAKSLLTYAQDVLKMGDPPDIDTVKNNIRDRWNKSVN
jgi:hypothetical protein